MWTTQENNKMKFSASANNTQQRNANYDVDVTESLRKSI